MTCDADGEQRWTFIKIDLGNNSSQTLSSRLRKFLGRGRSFRAYRLGGCFNSPQGLVSRHHQQAGESVQGKALRA